ncbi:MAG: hypothetical protein JSS07_07570 [Proteobacteria bacterium]|nr:hypothetical protein [Pseudomonadota bacterium]
MIIQSDDSTTAYQIKRFEPGRIWINEDCYHNSVIIQPNGLQFLKAQKLSDITNEDFASLIASKIDIVLLGTGAKLIIPPQSLLLPFFEKGIGLEFMDSRAACYTYTVLAGERNVAACILIL